MDHKIVYKSRLYYKMRVNLIDVILNIIIQTIIFISVEYFMYVFFEYLFILTINCIHFGRNPNDYYGIEIDRHHHSSYTFILNFIIIYNFNDSLDV